jgi:integrase
VGSTPVSEMQPCPVELWLRELSLAPKSKAHIRNLLHTLLDFAMWSEASALVRNPMSLVAIKGASDRIRQPRNLTVEPFQKPHKELREPTPPPAFSTSVITLLAVPTLHVCLDC